jgi:hypothetical protein
MNQFFNYLYICFALFLLMAGCKSDPTMAEQMDSKFTVCYRAISENDTAYLTIDTSDHKMIGFLKIIYPAQKKTYDGQIEGFIHGDTLLGHFDFKVNSVDKWYRNPVAFLKKRETLTMGVGDIAMVWGSAYFDEKKKIDYEKGRFVFELGECEKK